MLPSRFCRMPEQSPFTGRARRKRTPLHVRLADRFASGLITVGGIGTIVAVCGVCVYLVVTVLPLFGRAELGAATPLSATAQFGVPQAVQVSETNDIGWLINPAGELVVFRPRTGKTLQKSLLLGHGEKLSCLATSRFNETVAVGLTSGAVRLGSIQFQASFPDPGKFAAVAEHLIPGQAIVDGGSVVTRTQQGQFRREEVVGEFSGNAVEVSATPVKLVDFATTDAGPVLLTWSEDGVARLITVGRSENVFTGEVELSPGVVTPLPLPAGYTKAGPPRFVRLGIRGSAAYLAWADGRTLRFDCRNVNRPRLVESIDLAPGDRTQLTALNFQVGGISLLVGDSAGQLSAWFPARTRQADAETPVEPAANEVSNTSGSSTAAAAASAVDAPLTRGHVLRSGGPAVTAVAAAPRSRVAAAGFADGSIRLYQVTNEAELAESRISAEANPAANATGIRPPALVITQLRLPPGDGAGTMYAVAGGRLYQAPMDVEYHEAGLSAFFGTVWYESYPDASYVWQTSSATSAAEPKFGLMPLVFGTLKATFYSMLFAVPLALLAAIYTSEFLTKSTRARVKPMIEVMASLPSVVLGFLAAIVFAPWVRDWLPAVIAAAATIPFILLFSAHLWQLLPSHSRRRLEWLRMPLAGLAVLLGCALARLVGPWIEQLCFAGNVETWLAGRIGSGFAAWMLLWLPLSVILVAIASLRWVNAAFVAASIHWTRPQAALADMGRFLLLATATVLLASTISGLLTAVGLDPRGSFVDTYVARNALIVGVGMGFAIIPLIYTLADDALNSVPESLRSASLGAGATPWQTAVRVVIPTATSGLFSAIMVGLGRAVGETMIVLMAAGNTPIMKWNIFNGFETLSAAIATEMSEAARGSTHFRVLFLAALVLFALTFLVNTVAELVRIRFRKRVVSL